MRDFVGVRPFTILLHSPSLKRDALTFNRIAIPGCEFPQASEMFTILESFNEYEWLLEQGIIFDPSNSDLELWKKIMSRYRNDPVMEQIREFRKSKVNNDEYKRGISQFLAQHQVDADDDVIEVVDIFLDIFLHGEYILRPVSVLLRESQHVDAYPVFTVKPDYLQKTQASKDDVVEIVLSALPIPDDLVSWEQIMEYRSDPDTEGKFLALRNWMNEVARAELAPSEVEDKLEWLLYEYQKHLELHKMKINTGTFETIIIATAECLENLVKLNLGQVAKGLFSLKHRKISLIEGELNAPGNEIAYIVKAKEIFS